MNMNDIRGIIFDYGGTIDSNGKHWAEVLWEAYTTNQVPVSKENFRQAYVYGERYLATHHVIEKEDTFKDVLAKKVDLQMNWLIENGFLSKNDKTSDYSFAVSNQCYNFANLSLGRARNLIEKLSGKYPLVLVSNFYGNIESVLDDFKITQYFKEIVESAVVGIRKPDPGIFVLGVKALGFLPEEVVVIGDSHSKDIVPAHQIGCKTIWLRGIGWEEEKIDSVADLVIVDFQELNQIFE